MTSTAVAGKIILRQCRFETPLPMEHDVYLAESVIVRLPCQTSYVGVQYMDGDSDAHVYTRRRDAQGADVGIGAMTIPTTLVHKLELELMVLAVQKNLKAQLSGNGPPFHAQMAASLSKAAVRA